MKKIMIAAGLAALATPAAAGKVELTPNMATVLQTAITSRNFNCPAVKMAWSKGDDAHGTVIKTFCGPADADGIYEHATFRVTIRPDETLEIKPWTD